MIRSVNTAPGRAVPVATVKKPFSYYVPFQQLGATEGIWDRAGNRCTRCRTATCRPSPPSSPSTQHRRAPAGQRTTGHEGRRRLQGGGFKGGKGTAQPSRPDQPIQRPIPHAPHPDDPRAALRPFGPDAKREVWRPDGKGLSYLQMEPAPEGRESMGGWAMTNRTRKR